MTKISKPKEIKEIKFNFHDFNPAINPYDGEYATATGLWKLKDKIEEQTEAINYLLKKVK